MVYRLAKILAAICCYDNKVASICPFRLMMRIILADDCFQSIDNSIGDDIDIVFLFIFLTRLALDSSIGAKLYFDMIKTTY